LIQSTRWLPVQTWMGFPWYSERKMKHDWFIRFHFGLLIQWPSIHHHACYFVVWVQLNKEVEKVIEEMNLKVVYTIRSVGSDDSCASSIRLCIRHSVNRLTGLLLITCLHHISHIFPVTLQLLINKFSWIISMGDWTYYLCKYMYSCQTCQTWALDNGKMTKSCWIIKILRVVALIVGSFLSLQLNIHWSRLLESYFLLTKYVNNIYMFQYN
jgi:hypothetical protein